LDGVDKCFAIQAGREIRIMVKPEDVSDSDIALIARDIVKRIENELDYPGQITSECYQGDQVYRIC